MSPLQLVESRLLLSAEHLADPLSRLPHVLSNPGEHLPSERIAFHTALSEDLVDAPTLIRGQVQLALEPRDEAVDAERAAASVAANLLGVEQVGPQHAHSHADDEQREHSDQCNPAFHEPSPV
jgi:hypothetical protein